ncbi:MAG: uroporphyrinogen decarboxylase family protein [Planctomycetota bacterium]|jgi:uroporphyrinogen decarboxylase
MTPRELVKAAIEHRQTDVVPYYILLTGEAEERIRASLGVADVAGWLDNDVQPIAVPWWGWNELADDWRGFDAPTSKATVIGTGSYDNIADNVKAARDASDKYFLVRIYGSHFEKAYFARGFENFMADIAAHYDFAKKLCRRIVEKNLVMLENFLNLPEIDGVLLGSDWGSQRGLLMSPDVWDDMIRPGEQAEYDLVHSYGKDVWVHSCGDVSVLVPRLVEMGLDVLNPLQAECMDIERIKKDCGDKLAFWGGISTQQTLPFGTPDEVKAEARRVRDLLAAGGGYVFSPSQAVQGDVPVENIQALLAVAREGR